MTRILNNEEVDQKGKRKDIEEKRPAKGKPKVVSDSVPDSPEKERKVFRFQPHDLRHTFATALYDAGVDVKSAQYYLGHADIRVTMDLYTHLSEEREKKSRAVLISFLDGWLAPAEEVTSSPENQPTEKNDSRMIVKSQKSD